MAGAAAESESDRPTDSGSGAVARGFCTAAGKKVQPSASAMKRAESMMQAVEQGSGSPSKRANVGGADCSPMDELSDKDFEAIDFVEEDLSDEFWQSAAF